MKLLLRLELLLLFCNLVAVLQANDKHVIASSSDIDTNDSLRPALDAIERRRRDLAGHGDRQLPSFGSLSHYRYPSSRKRSSHYPSLERTGPSSIYYHEGGQPEDIGYGYQKSSSLPFSFSGLGGSSKHMPFKVLVEDSNEENEEMAEKMMEKWLIEYLNGGNKMRPNTADEDERKGYNSLSRFQDNEDDDNDDELRKKKSQSPMSLFRERSVHDSDDGDFNGDKDMETTAFRERLLKEEGEENEDESDDENEKRKRFLTLVKKMGEDQKKEEDVKTVSSEEMDEYLHVLKGLWEKFRDQYPNVDIGDLTREDIENILALLQKHGIDLESGEISSMFSRENKKRKSPTILVSPYDLETYNALYTAGKRFDDVQRRNQNKDDEGWFENSVSLQNRAEPDPWFPAFDKQDKDEPSYDLADIRALDKKFALKRNLPSRQEDNYGLEYLYKSKAKRFPVTKRSSPVTNTRQHNHQSGTVNQRRKKDTTDPKVTRELNDIFSQKAADKKVMEKRDDKNSSKPNVNATSSDKKQARVQTSTALNDATTAKPADTKTTTKSSMAPQKAKSISIRKKSIDWSEYFGVDKKKRGDGENGDEEEVNPWSLTDDSKSFALSTSVKKKRDMFGPKWHSEEWEGEEEGSTSNLDAMDQKLKNIEDLIVDEALKYTGAHEGARERNEIEMVKQKVMSRLAAAYSLEKMREALGEFKSNLNVLNNHGDGDEANKDYEGEVEDEDNMKKKKKDAVNETDGKNEDKKRVAIKKPSADFPFTKFEKEEDHKKKRDDDKKRSEDDNENSNFIENAVEPFSEGYMGLKNSPSLQDCPSLQKMIYNCRTIVDITGDLGHMFLETCNRHQVCYACGSALGYDSPTSCDIGFLDETDALCDGDRSCQLVARKIVTTLRKLRSFEWRREEQCWKDRCITDFLQRKR